MKVRIIVGVILSAALLLQHVGLDAAATAIETAVAADLAARDQAAPRGTRATGEAILARLG